MTTPALPPGERPAVVLHVGMGKTGTSTIQATFHRTRRKLRRQGVFFPKSPGEKRHIRLGLAMQNETGEPRQSVGWRRQAVRTPTELRPIFEEALFEEIAGLPNPLSHLVLSDEALLAASPEAVGRMRELMDRLGSSVRVVAYLRRQDDHLCSRYQQMVKREGEVRRLPERAALDMSRVYDYAAQLTTWREQMRPDEMVVRTFEPRHFVDGSLLADFVDAAGLGIDAGELNEAPRTNESLDAESVEFLRLFNLLHQERDERPALPLVGRIIRRLQDQPQGPTLTLPEPVLDAWMEQWRETYARVAAEFVPGAPPELFRTPRKTSGTTTEQHLDPARLDHFLEVTGLEEEMHAPLRRLAETEARAGAAGGTAT